MRKLHVVALLLGVATILGATVFREQVAAAAPPIRNVFVTNDFKSPVPVIAAGPVQPVFISDPNIFFSQGTFRATKVLYQVPAGHLLVIESVSVDTFVDTDDAGFHRALLVVSSAGFEDYSLNALPSDIVPGSLGDPPLGRHWIANHTLRIYVPAGESISLGAELNSAREDDSISRVEAALSGYLVPTS
jgi:hypothetical protein